MRADQFLQNGWKALQEEKLLLANFYVVMLDFTRVVMTVWVYWNLMRNELSPTCSFITNRQPAVAGDDVSPEGGVITSPWNDEDEVGVGFVVGSWG